MHTVEYCGYSRTFILYLKCTAPLRYFLGRVPRTTVAQSLPEIWITSHVVTPGVNGAKQHLSLTSIKYETRLKIEGEINKNARLREDERVC